MPRPGVTYDDVESAASALLGRGVPVSIQSVREELGRKGSPNTIHRHLLAWRQNRPKVLAPPVKLPDAVMVQLAEWVSDATAAGVAEANAALAFSQGEAMELAKSGEALEAERDALLAQVAALTTERDQSLAQAEERRDEIDRLANDIERERKLAGDAQIAAAQAQHKVESQAEHMLEMKTALQNLKATLESERNAKTEAEKRVAVLQAERDAGKRDAEEASAAVAAERAATAAERAQTDKERDSARAAAVENATLRAELQAAEKLVARLEAQLAKYEARVQTPQGEESVQSGGKPA